MAVCPKCSYALVLLPKRLRYKCAKCGRLFLQKFIDDREFQRWNKKQREFDRENLRLKRRKLTEEEKKQRTKQYQGKYRQKNREKINSYARSWRNKNKEKSREHVKKYKQKNKDKVNLRQRKWYHKNIEREREKVRQRIAKNREHHNKLKREWYHRNRLYVSVRRRKTQQLKKALALQASENNEYKASKPKISTSVPTYSLAQLLSKPKSFLRKNY